MRSDWDEVCVDQAPFVGIRIVTCVEQRIVGNDQHLEVGGTRVDELVRFTGRMEENVTGVDCMGGIAGADGAGAGLHDEHFPLGEVRVKRADRRARWYPPNLDIKRVAAAPRAAVANAAEREGNVLAERMEFSRWRMHLLPRQRRNVDLVHGGLAAT
jgi:hypothetical protein